MENWLRFKGSNNTRDLGGYPACGGKIVAGGRLIRSGELSRMNPEACRLLETQYHVHTLVDLRTSGEIERHPLPETLRASVVHIPILHQAMRGITRDDGSMKEKMDALLTSGVSEKEFMQTCYREMVSNAESMDGYRQLFEVLLEHSEGATVFFCSHGRDRTGIAAMLILAALGVSEQNIRKEYLLTPKDVLRKNKEIHLLKSAHFLSREQADFASAWLMPDVNRFDIALDWIKGEYGTLEQYLEEGIGLSSFEQKRLQYHYLANR